jgi:uncharacterized RDD family membrane protein YckC
VSELTPYPRAASEREEAEGPPDADLAYAGWWRRAAALLLDTVLIVALVMATGLTGYGLSTLNDRVGLLILVVAFVLIIGGPIFYSIYLTGKEPGQTVGKRVLGIRVRHAEHDRAIGYGAATGRYFITFIFGWFTIPLILDYLFPLWDGRNQTLHDKIANSIVVRV